jgi:acylaminoacyl-peptidase
MPNPDEYKQLYNCSPARFAENGGKTSPVLLMLGDGDRRVPHSQALRWAETLKGNGAQVEVLMFPGNGHAIDSLDAERYGVESASSFFQSLL